MKEPREIRNQGECIIEGESGAYVGILLPDWTYEQLQEAARISRFASIELVRKALDHYLEHWVGPPAPAYAPDAEMDIDHEMHRDLDTWIMDVIRDDSFELPTATIGVHFGDAEVEALYSVLDIERQETSIDFVRAAVLELIAKRQQPGHPAGNLDSSTEAAS